MIVSKQLALSLIVPSRPSRKHLGKALDLMIKLKELRVEKLLGSNQKYT